MIFLKILFIFFICLNISSSYASNIKNSAVVFMYHKFGVSKYPSTSVTIDQFDDHLKELSKGITKALTSRDEKFGDYRTSEKKD